MIAILLACAATGFAQEHMADTLRNGILEEDSKQNPRAAIQQYQAVMTQFAEARQTAATALFRMAECYRKQGNGPQAIAAYQRRSEGVRGSEQTGGTEPHCAGDDLHLGPGWIAGSRKAERSGEIRTADGGAKAGTRQDRTQPASAIGQPSKKRWRSTKSNCRW